MFLVLPKLCFVLFLYDVLKDAAAVSIEKNEIAANALTKKTIEEIVNVFQSWQQEFETSSSSAVAPFVTAAFAQSLDGYMAGHESATTSSTWSTTSNFPLSGKESMLLTHALRSIHDGIMVGGRTLSIDNPRLTNRLWGNTTLNFTSQPRPIVLDANLNHIQKLGRNCRLRNPIICCSLEAASSGVKLLQSDAILLACQCTAEGNLDIGDVLLQLKLRHGIRSIMVEGGASIISSFFKEWTVDALCITIVPKVMHSGIAPTFRKSTCQLLPIDLTSLLPRFLALGTDATLISRCH